MGEICKSCDWQGVNLQILQRAHVAQYQENNLIKNGQKTWIDISPKKNTCGQHANEKMLNITNLEKCKSKLQWDVILHQSEGLSMVCWSMKFSRQEYWNGSPSLFQRIQLGSPALQADSLPYEPPGKPQSEWSSSKRLQAINGGEGVEKREPSYTVGGTVKQYSHYGK